MKLKEYSQKFESKWPWFAASIILAFTLPWWLSMFFAAATVIIFGSYWPLILTGFVIDTLYAPYTELFYQRYLYMISGALITALLLALRKRLYFS